jgi:hypothetical protein
MTDENINDGVLFDGDTGTFPMRTRRAIARLVRGPSLTAERHPDEWAALLTDLPTVRRHLAEMFLTVKVDTRGKVAYAVQADAGKGTITMLNRVPLNLVQSAVLVSLRMTLSRALNTAEPATVTTDNLKQEVLAYQRYRNQDETGTRASVDEAIKKLSSATVKIITPLKGSDQEYVISPALATLFGATELQRLLDVLTSEADGDIPSRTETPDGTDDGEDTDD